ncbi:MAG: acetolactate synthase, partial [Clostridiales Family XIII bacterium]|nr:acetolactate synthase [Clostridiales Family XIII bacterium]
MTIDQISVFVEYQPGRLAEITEILGEADVDLRAMSIADTAD